MILALDKAYCQCPTQCRDKSYCAYRDVFADQVPCKIFPLFRYFVRFKARIKLVKGFVSIKSP